jgi:hypothetical protein
MNYNNLNNYYVLNYTLHHHHDYSLDEIENMIPFEREVYCAMIREEIERKNREQ